MLNPLKGYSQMTISTKNNVLRELFGAIKFKSNSKKAIKDTKKELDSKI